VKQTVPLSRRAVRCSLALVLLVTIISFLIYPNVLVGTSLAVLFTDMELSVVVVLFAGMFFLLFLLLYLGGH
jgi:hypothetical protein